jgi:hypothetical protein
MFSVTFASKSIVIIDRKNVVIDSDDDDDDSVDSDEEVKNPEPRMTRQVSYHCANAIGQALSFIDCNY